MPPITFPGKQLQPSTLGSRMPPAICTPGRLPKAPRKISERDTELESLLRNASRPRNAQKQAVRTKTGDSKGNRKAR
jgi:hypothetical protein